MDIVNQNFSKNDLLQILIDLSDLQELFRRETHYISYGLNHILNKENLFRSSPLFGVQMTPNEKTNTKGPSLRYFSANEGDISIRLNDDLLVFSHNEARGYIFLSPLVNRDKIKFYSKSLQSFGWGTGEREEHKLYIAEAYCKDMLIEISKSIRNVKTMLSNI